MSPVELELSFRDAMTFLLTRASQRWNAIEHHAAATLCRFLVLGPVLVLWSANGRVRGASRDLEGIARSIEPEECGKLRRELGVSSSELRHDDLQVSLFEADPTYWAVELSAAPIGQEGLLIIVNNSLAQQSVRVRFFRMYLTGQIELITAVRALHGNDRLAESEWSREIEHIIGSSQRTLAERFRRASVLIDEMAHRPTPETAELVERLSIWAMQQHLGTGWRVRRLTGRLSDLRALVKSIRVAAACCADHADAFTENPAQRLSCLADVLAAEDDGIRHRPWGAIEQVDGRWEGLELLRRWTLVQEVARTVWRQNAAEHSGQEALAVWLDVARGTRNELAELLARWFPRANADAAHLRNWLRLWLCLELDWTQSDEELSDQRVPDPWRWRADLAYVLREGLRFACFGSRPDYLVQPDALSESLRTLVEFHASSVVGVPYCFDIRWILIEIARVHRADEYGFMTGHVQHAVESYIFGNFMCKMRIRATEDEGRAFDGWTVAELLASRGSERDPVRAQVMIQSYCVGSLFHDVGMILFPRFPEVSETLAQGRDDELHRQLAELRRKLRGAGMQVSQVCVRDLQNGGYVRAEESELGWWLAQEERSEDRPDHALLGAWFLHRIYHRYPEALEVLGYAVRAVLLHQVFPQTIDMGKDPAAGLLALADEVFEWDPYHRLVPVQDPTSRSLHTMAVAMPPEASRAQRVQLRNTEARAVSGHVQVTILYDGTSLRGFPHVTLTLKHPELLDGKVHHYWLTMAQNLGRIRAFRGFSPGVEVRSTVPPWLDENSGTRQRLKSFFFDCPLPIATSWRTWLTPGHRFVMEEGGTVEVVHLGALQDPFKDDVRDHMLSIDLAMDAHPPEARRSTFPPPPDDS